MSHTSRHLCEFVGLDFEMQIVNHYYEAIEVRQAWCDVGSFTPAPESLIH
jgi:aspartyl/asparaginyl-tRNA synthetase